DQRPDLAASIQDGLEPLEQTSSPAVGALYSGKFVNARKIRSSRGINKIGRESLPGLSNFVEGPLRLAVTTVIMVMMVVAGESTANHRTDQRPGEHAADVAIAIAVVAVTAVAVRRIAIAVIAVAVAWVG